MMDVAAESAAKIPDWEMNYAGRTRRIKSSTIR